MSVDLLLNLRKNKHTKNAEQRHRGIISHVCHPYSSGFNQQIIMEPKVGRTTLHGTVHLSKQKKLNSWASVSRPSLIS